MSEVEEDYSDYIKHMSNISGLGSVLAGFTLTTLTLLITLLPDPSQIPVQITLFFLASLFDTFMFLTGWTGFHLVYFCRRAPPLTRQQHSQPHSGSWFLHAGRNNCNDIFPLQSALSCVGINDRMGIIHYRNIYRHLETLQKIL
jgi:hypothetical protein